MNLQLLLNKRNISKYHFSKISKIPKTTIMDICSGKSLIENCSAKTIQRLSHALDISMEMVMALGTDISESVVDINNNVPTDKRYLECGLPQYLQDSLDALKKSWIVMDRGEQDYRFDVYWCELNADINGCEVEQRISSEQANYLRDKYLRIVKDDI